MAQREIKAGSAFVELALRDRTQAMLNRAARRFKTFSADIGRMGTRALAIGAAMAASLAPAVMAASKMQETMSKFNVVFGDSAERMKGFSDQMAQTFGRSKRQIAEFLSSAQDLFVPLGFDPKQAEELSKTITGLSMDLASFNNMADADTFRDLQAAITGSGEVMKKYGVLVDEAAVKQELLNNGMSPKTATNQQKVLARLAIILRGTTAAQGDAIRTSDSFANQLKRARGAIENIAGTIGSALIPVLSDIAKYVNRAFVAVEMILSQNKGLILGFAAVAAGITAAGAALVSISGIALGASAAFSGLATMIGVLTSPITIVTGAVVALGERILFHTKAGGRALQWLSARFQELRDFVAPIIQGIADTLAGGDLRLAAQIAWQGIQMAWEIGTAKVKKWWDLMLYGMIDTLDQWMVQIKNGWRDVVGFIADRLIEIGGFFTDIDVEAVKATRRQMTGEAKGRSARGLHERQAARARDIDSRVAAREKELAETMAQMRASLEASRAQAKQSRQQAAMQFEQFKNGKFVPQEFNLAGVGAAVQNIRARGTFGSLLGARMGLGTAQDIPKQQLDELKAIKNKLGEVEQNTREGNEFA